MAEASNAKACANLIDRRVNAIESKLIALCARLRLLAVEAGELADGNAHPTRTAPKIAADIVSEYTQGVGAAGVDLYTIITEAADLDAARSRDGAAR